MAFEVNRIKEIYPNHFWVLLDFPTKDILYTMIDDSYRYIWGINHAECLNDWKQNSCNLLGNVNRTLWVRNLRMEFLMETENFRKLIPDIRQGVHLVQLNKMPPYYLSSDSLKGKARYDALLREGDYLFEIKLPPSPDYTEVVSPNRKFLEKLIV